MGQYIAIVIMELIVALPAYYILRAVFKRRSVEVIALVCLIIAIGVGWVAGYRLTKDIMTSNYLAQAQRSSIQNTGNRLTQDNWSRLYKEFNSEHLSEYHVGAAKMALPPAFFVAIILFWLAERHKKKSEMIDDSSA